MQWTLGLTEGAQTVTASVGALAAVTFTATGVVSTAGAGSVTPAGAILGLPDGTRVVVPPGAVTGAARMTLTRVDPSAFFGSGGPYERTMVSLTSSVRDFAQDLEVRLPLPTGFTVADSSRVFASFLGPANTAMQIMQSEIRMIDQRPLLVVKLRKLADPIAASTGEEPFSGTVVAHATPVPPATWVNEVPFYSQGNSKYCWAANTHTVTQTVKFDNDRSTAEIIASMNVDDTGLYGHWLWGKLQDIVRQRTGNQKDWEVYWDLLPANANAQDIIKAALAVRKVPVLWFNTNHEHTYVLLGYDRDKFLVLDANIDNMDRLGYQEMTWQQLTSGTLGSIWAAYTSSDPAPRPQTLTVDILPDAFVFARLEGTINQRKVRFRSSWNYRQKPEGYDFWDEVSNSHLTLLPGHVNWFTVPDHLKVYNSSRSNAVDATAKLEVKASGTEVPAGWGGYSRQVTMRLLPNTGGTLSFRPAPGANADTILVDLFRFNRVPSTNYEAVFSAESGGQTVSQKFNFVIASVTPELTAITPEAARPGDVVKLSGRNLGMLALHNEVLFNGNKATDIVSWMDDSVKVRVPAGATSGPVEFWRGRVVANDRLPFTVYESERSRTFDLTWGTENFQDVRVNATVEVTALSADAGWLTTHQLYASQPERAPELYFGTLTPPASAPNTYRVKVHVNSISTSALDDVTLEQTKWWGLAQAEDNPIESTVIGDEVIFGENRSTYARTVYLVLDFGLTAKSTGEYVGTSTMLGLHFSPQYVGFGGQQE